MNSDNLKSNWQNYKKESEKLFPFSNEEIESWINEDTIPRNKTWTGVFTNLSVFIILIFSTQGCQIF